MEIVENFSTKRESVHYVLMSNAAVAASHTREENKKKKKKYKRMETKKTVPATDIRVNNQPKYITHTHKCTFTYITFVTILLLSVL